MITKELIIELYTKYDGTPEEGGRDTWDVAADIINEIVPRENYKNDASYFFDVKEVWNMIQEYVNSTYEV